MDNEKDEVLSPFVCRAGNKRRLRSRIAKYIPAHKTYVEAFVGSGAIFFSKPLAERNIINDLDKSVIKIYRLLKKGIPLEAETAIPSGIPAQQKLANARNSGSDKNQFLGELIQACNTYSSKGYGKIYKDTTHIDKLKKLDSYKKKLKNTVIKNTDYKNIIREYDSPTTFFFLDPPYENSKKQDLYKLDEEFNFEEMNDILRKIKGKFLLTINDSANIRRIFKGFKIVSVTVEGGAQGGSSPIGQKDRKELFVMNL